MNSSHRIIPAAGIVILSALMFAAMDACSKHVVAVLPVAFIIWVRFTMQSIVMGLVVVCTLGRCGFRVRQPGFQVLRGVLIVACSAATVIGLRFMPLAELTAIQMLSPVLVTAMAGRVLNETVDTRRMALVIGGFLSTIMVLRPGSALFGLTSLIPLFGMLFLSGYHLVSGYLAGRENAVTTQFYTGLTGSAVLLPVVVWQAETVITALPTLSVGIAAALISIGLLGTLSYLLLNIAFRREGAASLMPYIYAQIGFAALIGLLVFGHMPDFFAWSGMAIITLCGIGSALMRSPRRET